MGSRARLLQGQGSDQSREEVLFDILSNRRRRYAVFAISGTEEVELGTLAERIAAWENEQPESAVTSDERKRVYTSLQQSHIPKLSEAGLVDYDDRASVVRPQPTLEEYEVYMEVVRGREMPWNQYYLGLSGVSLALLLAVVTDAVPFDALPDVAWLAAVVVAFSVSALVHTYYVGGTKLSGDGTPPEVEVEE